MTPDTTRHETLTASLGDWRRRLQEELRQGLSDGRAELPQDIGDMVEDTDAHLQSDLDYALLQMKADTLVRLDAALRRVEEGHYGECVTCGEAISTARLRALPFAVNCHACASRQEAESSSHHGTPGRDLQSLFPEMLRP